MGMGEPLLRTLRAPAMGSVLGCVFGAWAEVRGLFLCNGSGVEYETVDWKAIDREMAEYNAGRVFRDANVFQDFAAHYARCSAERKDLFEDEPAFLGKWRSEFMENSLKYVLCAADDASAPEQRSRSLRSPFA